MFEGETASQRALILSKPFDVDAHSSDLETDTGRDRPGHYIADKRRDERVDDRGSRLAVGIEDR